MHEADSVEISNALEMYREGDFDAIIENHPTVQKDEILRIFLVLQHNAFASGLYKYLSLFNHSCIPNCIKFSPKPANNRASEIWTVRSVNAGEELTICYADNPDTTIKSMQEYLKLNHRFNCICGRCCSLPNNNKISSSVSVDEVSKTITVDDFSSIPECEHLSYEETWKEELIAMESELKWQTVEENKSNFRACRDIIKACKMRISAAGSIPEIDVEGCAQYCTCGMLQNRTFKALVNASAQCVEALHEIKSNPKESVKYANKLATIDDFEIMVEFFVNNLYLASGVVSRYSY